MVWSSCPVCGEFPKPLLNWNPKETALPGGGVRIEGTPFYCACNRPAEGSSPPSQPPNESTRQDDEVS
jgi:hypothetical protein